MRYLDLYLEKDLTRKMVFLGGPRQVGKTTVAKSLLQNNTSGQYFNWDSDEDRRAILNKQWRQSDSLIVFDEIHKHPAWKNWVKGVYDTKSDTNTFLITGSARLDVYKKGGDSLFGRYHYWRLHPFTLEEIPDNISPEDAFERLMTLGGFPEPFISNDETIARRWRKERFDRVVLEDIRDLESVKNIQHLKLLVDLLKSRVGGGIVMANLARDLGVSAPSIKSWIDVLERMYLVFSVRPYSQKLVRSLHKMPKVYFYDNADVDNSMNQGARFENLVATTLIKRLNFLEDRDGYRYELKYLRDKEGKEVDFVIVKDNEIEEIIETKWNDDSISPSLYYYSQRLKPKKATQIVANLKRSYSKNGIEVLSPLEYFSKPLVDY